MSHTQMASLVDGQFEHDDKGDFQSQTFCHKECRDLTEHRHEIAGEIEVYLLKCMLFCTVNNEMLVFP